MSKELNWRVRFGTGYSTISLLILAGLFHLTASRPQDADGCDNVDIQKFPEYLERCEDNISLCSVVNCTLFHPDKEQVCYTKPKLLPVEFCQSLSDLKIPDDCSSQCCQELKSFLPVGSQAQSNCVHSCNFQDATSQLCQYLNLAIQTYYPTLKDDPNLVGIDTMLAAKNTNIPNNINTSVPSVSAAVVDATKKTPMTNNSLPEQLKEIAAEQGTKGEYVIKPTLTNTSTQAAFDLSGGGNELSADGNSVVNLEEEITGDVDENEVNKVKTVDVQDTQEVPQITNSVSPVDEVIKDNTEIKDDTDSNVDSNQVIDPVNDDPVIDQVNDPVNDDPVIDQVNDTVNEDPVNNPVNDAVNDEEKDYPIPPRNKEADAEEEAYENSDIVDIDAAGGIDLGPYPPSNPSHKVGDTMNKGPYADDDSSFMGYFLMMSGVCIVAYLVFHNKQKILALILEGRRAQGSRRRSGGRVYSRVNSTVEDSMNLNRESSLKQVIY